MADPTITAECRYSLDLFSYEGEHVDMALYDLDNGIQGPHPILSLGRFSWFCTRGQVEQLQTMIAKYLEAK